MFQYNKLFASASIALMLSACGGGSKTTMLTPPPTPTPTPVPAPPPPPPPATTFAFFDEFDGTKLDATKWGYQLGNGATVNLQGWGNNELEYYTDRAENVTVKDGNLVITARKEAFTGTVAGGNNGQAFTWTSGRIRTSGKFSRTYGKIEIRAKLPAGKGFWPAIWMLPELEGNPYKSWGANGEIDIAEGFGSRPTKVAHTLHYGAMWPENKYDSTEATIATGSTVSEWHTYTLEWRSNEIKWSIDGVVTATKTNWWSSNVAKPTTDADLNAWPAPFDKPFYLLINLAVGGNFDGNPTAATPDTAEMVVDYVRWSSLPDENRAPGARPSSPFAPPPAGVARPILNGNLIYNPSFDWTATNATVVQSTDEETIEGATNSYFWNLFKLDGEATASNVDGVLKIDVTNPGTQAWNVQLQHNHLPITKGRKYRLSFDARSSVARSMTYTVGATQSRNFESYTDGDQTAELTTTMQPFTRTFNMTADTNNDARIAFNLAKAGVNSVWIDNVMIEDMGAADAPAVPPPVVPPPVVPPPVVPPPVVAANLLKNGDFSTGLTSWETYVERTGMVPSVQGGAATMVITDVVPGEKWYVQLYQTGVSLIQGKTYTLTFKGSSTAPKNIEAVVGEIGGGYARYLNEKPALTTTPTAFKYTFVSPVTNPNAQIQILGNDGATGDDYTLTFDDFTLTVNP